MPDVTEQRLVKARSVYISRLPMRYAGGDYHVIGMSIELEDNRIFTMVNIPPDVAEAIAIFLGERGYPSWRQSLFTLLLQNESLREALSEGIEKVIIDELDERSGVYSATVVFKGDGVSMSIKMIPSHAVYLALLAGKSIYVHEELLEKEQE